MDDAGVTIRGSLAALAGRVLAIREDDVHALARAVERARAAPQPGAIAGDGDRTMPPPPVAAVRGEWVCCGDERINAYGYTRTRGGLGVVPVRGAMVADAPEWWAVFGVLNHELLAESIRAAEADPDVGIVVLDMSCPGGTAAGMHDLAEATLGVTKPIYAVAHHMAASAAYWLASCTNGIYATPDAIVGSIGTMIALYDDSKMFAKFGLRAIPIRTGERKGPVPGESPTEDQIEAYRDLVTDLHTQFLAAVARRGVTEGKAVELDGRVLSASAAFEHGLVDAVGSFEGILRTLEAAQAGATPQTRTSPTRTTQTRTPGRASERAVAAAHGDAPMSNLSPNPIQASVRDLAATAALTAAAGLAVPPIVAGGGAGGGAGGAAGAGKSPARGTRKPTAAAPATKAESDDEDDLETRKAKLKEDDEELYNAIYDDGKNDQDGDAKAQSGETAPDASQTNTPSAGVTAGEARVLFAALGEAGASMALEAVEQGRTRAECQDAVIAALAERNAELTARAAAAAQTQAALGDEGLGVAEAPSAPARGAHAVAEAGEPASYWDAVDRVMREDNVGEAKAQCRVADRWPALHGQWAQSGYENRK